jgi:hypothetical protein
VGLGEKIGVLKGRLLVLVEVLATVLVEVWTASVEGLRKAMQPVTLLFG